jgi:hypothetical protein
VWAVRGSWVFGVALRGSLLDRLVRTSGNRVGGGGDGEFETCMLVGGFAVARHSAGYISLLLGVCSLAGTERSWVLKA